ncbi:MAG: ABC-type transport auxiliary lipoprotein family protein [Gammaproteobacteria bacterium]|nr:ABC-type transport auxiliary lipoprotein family protein [Gammaproteobacteria bacterium]
MIKKKLNNVIKISVLLLILIFIAACTPSVNKVDPHKYYTLSFSNSDNRVIKPIYDFVKIDLPHISTKHMTKSIVYSEKPFQKNSYSQSQWKEPLPIMLQEWLVQSINNMNLFKGVIRVESRANVPMMLETDIVKFEHIIYKDEVNISLRVILIQYKKREIIKQKLFNYRVKVKQATAESAVLSFNEAIKQFNNDLFFWLEKNE